MTALELLREKKFKGQELTAAEQIILDAYYSAKDNHNLGRILLAETAANELAHLQERIKEHLPLDIMRKRKGDKKWRRLFYSKLTRASARRWHALKEKGVCIIRRDVQRELFESATNSENWIEVKR